MKKSLFIIAAAAVILTSGCGAVHKTPVPDKNWEAAQLDVYIEASLAGAADAIASKYNAEHPEHTIVFNAGSAEELKNAIENGAKCDIIIADDNVTATLGEEYIDVSTVTQLASDKYVLIKQKNGETPVSVLDDVEFAESVALTGYTAGITDIEEDKIILLQDDREVITAVEDGIAEVGIVRGSYAVYGDVAVIDEVPAETDVYTAARAYNGSGTVRHNAAADEFFEYITSYKAASVFTGFGFSVY